ncbi:MAG: DUF2891 domain-containing protein [Vicinamibacterales bacterium]
MLIDPSIGSRFAGIALGHVAREYPNKLDHVLNGPADLKSPRTLHPMFFGSFDWHSNVHACWLLATMLRRVPDLPQRQTIRDLFNDRFTEAHVATEVAYLAQPLRGTFERPYGWAWLLMLAAELTRHATGEGRLWAARLAPLAAAFSSRFRSFLPNAPYPIRAGTHGNTAFALSLAFEYAGAAADESLATTLRTAALQWYEGDADCQAWEPSGDDFLSPALTEAECMRRALPRDAWQHWFDRFLPRVAERAPATLFEPASVHDRTDGRIVHLDGLNLSRAWCWRNIAASLEPDDARRAIAVEAADAHLASALPHLSDDYAGEHWLATFALLAMTGGETS